MNRLFTVLFCGFLVGFCHAKGEQVFARLLSHKNSFSSPSTFACVGDFFISFSTPTLSREFQSQGGFDDAIWLAVNAPPSTVSLALFAQIISLAPAEEERERASEEF